MEFLRSLCSCMNRKEDIYANVEISHFELIGHDDLD